EVFDLKLMDGIHNGSGPSSLRGRLAASRGRPNSLLRPGRIQCVARYDSRRAHHVENPGCEAEEQKHDHPPRRNSEPAIKQPADGRTDHNRGHELGRESKTAGDRGGAGGRPLIRTASGRTVSMDAAEPFAEALKSR